MWHLLGEIIVSLLVIVGCLLLLFVSIRQLTIRDAIGRVNALGPMTAPGIPLIAIGAFLGWTLESGFSWVLLLKTIITVIAAVFVSSVATNVLARAVYMSGAPVDPRTYPNDLAHDPLAPERLPDRRVSPDGEQSGS